MLSIYHTSLQEYLSPAQIVLLEMLVRVIQIFKEIKIEKLAGRLPLPIKFESRRRAIQRFLVERALDISLLWLPIIKQIVDRKMSEQKHRTRKKDSTEKKKIYLAMDRTQWKDHNILMIAIILDKSGSRSGGFLQIERDKTEQCQFIGSFWIKKAVVI
jgi:hypothetical protein